MLSKTVMNYGDNAYLLNPDGQVIWEGSRHDRLSALKKCADEMGEQYNVLARTCGATYRHDGSEWITPAQVTQQAIDLQFIAREGGPSGHFTLLPRVQRLYEAAEVFNAHSNVYLDAHKIQFPLVFNNNDIAMQELTQISEDQGHLYAVGKSGKRKKKKKKSIKDKGLRLAYAADPGLFDWLRYRKLEQDKLPYTVVSPMLAMRNVPKGDRGSFANSAETVMPDTHILTHKDDAKDQLLRLTELNSQSAQYWVGDSCAQFIDIRTDFLKANPDIPVQMAKAAGRYTLVNTLEECERYYEFRAGIQVDAGYKSVMLFNTQWDEQNAPRFQFTVKEDKSHPVVLHTNGLLGAGLLNTVIGRGMTEQALKAIPPELSPHPVTLIALDPTFKEAAETHALRFQQLGINTKIIECPSRRKLGRIVWPLKKQWTPAFAVIGAEEANAGSLVLQQGQQGTMIAEATFVGKYKDRIERCTPFYVQLPCDLPF